MADINSLVRIRKAVKAADQLPTNISPGFPDVYNAGYQAALHDVMDVLSRRPPVNKPEVWKGD